MAKQKFNIIETQKVGSLKKVLLPPIPNFQTKPSVIIGKTALAVSKKLFINTGKEGEDDKPQSFALSGGMAFNTPVYCDVELHGGSYTDENGKDIQFAGIVIELALMTVMNQKNIIETTLQGRNGTVKEYISDGDYQIKITGKLYGPGANAYPLEDVQKLIAICLAPQAITITSSFLKMFDNTESIVIKSYEIDQVEATRNYQDFILNCVSDRELILLKNA